MLDSIQGYQKTQWETLVKFEPKSNCQYQFSSFVHLQQGLNVLRKTF